MPRIDAATTDVNNWDMNNFHVAAEIAAGEFVSAESTLIASGPPQLRMLAYKNYDSADDIPNEIDNLAPSPTSETGSVFPLGAAENIGLNQAQQVQRIFEIGSVRSYFIPGKVIGNLTIGRILHSGPSLLKAMYAYYMQNNTAAKFRFMHKGIGADLFSNYGFVMPDPDRTLLDLSDLQSQLVAIQSRPGYGDLYLSLASDLFKQPTGIMMYFRNSLNQDFGAVYLETVHVNAHQMSINAGTNVIMEGVTCEFDKLRPVNVTISDYIPAMANA